MGHPLEELADLGLDLEVDVGDGARSLLTRISDGAVILMVSWPRATACSAILRRSGGRRSLDDVLRAALHGVEYLFEGVVRAGTILLLGDDGGRLDAPGVG